MFTGIITALGEIECLNPDKKDEVVKFQISILGESKNSFLNSTKVGDSIAVNGVCLTVISFDNDYFVVEASSETLNKTNLSRFLGSFLEQEDKIVNLEHALKMGDSLDGHLVQGHIDTVIEIHKITNQRQNKVIEFILSGLDNKHIEYIAPKGSVTINGVSLTVNKVVNDNTKIFTVNIIPHTLENTNFKYLKQGTQVNLEIDMFARYSINYIKNYLEG